MAESVCHKDVQVDYHLHISNDAIHKMAVIFKALADPTRLKIIYALVQEKKLCVCEIAQIIHSSNATASHHLNYLKEQKLATSERIGKQMYYEIADYHVRQLIEIAQVHSEEDTQL